MSEKKNISFLFLVKNNIKRINLIVVILLALGIFFLLYRFPIRVDLTRTQAFTLSDASKDLVRNLNDPIRIKVFISENLPAPLNEVEINLRDILEEYNEVGGNQFTYEFFKIDEKKEKESPQLKKNLDLASEYGIAPQQVQSFEKDEVKLVRSYLGLVLEYGNSIEKIPFLNNNSSLEYQLTELISKLTRKNDKIIGLSENLKITLYINEAFIISSTYFGINNLSKAVSRIKETIEQVKKDNFNKVDFEVKNQLNNKDLEFLQSLKVRSYPWETFKIKNVGTFPKGVGYAVLTITHGEKKENIELLKINSALQLTAQGLNQVTTYQLIDLNERLKENINGIIESLLEINEKIAYLKDKGTVPVSQVNVNPFQANIFGKRQKSEGANFYNALSKTYTVEEVSLEQLGGKYNSLIIAGATEEFSDYDLLLIDQFLMRGKSVIVFQDSYVVESINPQAPPHYKENKNNLDKLIQHYGINQGESIVLDKKSYTSRQQTITGSVQETKIYFAPIIQNINNNFTVLENIREFIFLQSSPLTINQTNLNQHNQAESIRLFSSSVNSWLMQGNISLIPQTIIPPNDEDKYASQNLAYIINGEFTSYFSDKEIPSKPEEKEEDKKDSSDDENLTQNNKKNLKSNLVEIKSNSLVKQEVNQIIKQGKRGRLLVMGTSQVIKNNVFNEGGKSINAVYLLNLIDYMNNREDWGIMRGKGQYSNPLEDFDEKAGLFKRVLTNRDLVKFFNMVGLPILIGIMGFISFNIKNNRRKKILNLYKKN